MNTVLSHHYLDMGPQFGRQNLPTQVQSPASLLWNKKLARQLNLNLSEEAKASYFSGTKLFQGSKPISMTYSGHQFGHFNPQLGDGRAHLLGELIDQNGNIQELHLKGSGQTPYSRNGDGKCGIKPAIREYIMSEALFALGVPTTRCLSVVTTSEQLMRQHKTTGAVVTRVAPSHLRVGTFEYFAARKMHTEIQVLADLCINRHHHQIDKEDSLKYLKMLSEVIDKQINLTTEWMRVGFIHGVLNTDNTLLSGETIDYGPCAMMGAYNPKTVFSSIDHNGRYAYGNQPAIIQWNMARLAECLLPLIDTDEKKAIALVMPLIENFNAQYNSSYHLMMANKIGFDNGSQLPSALLQQLLDIMFKNKLDYTQTFISLGDSFNQEHSIHSSLHLWHEEWLNTLNKNHITSSTARATMANSNPMVIPRNHHVEAVLNKTEETLKNDAALPFIEVLEHPYSNIKNTSMYIDSDANSDLNYQTFCGT